VRKGELFPLIVEVSATHRELQLLGEVLIDLGEHGLLLHGVARSEYVPIVRIGAKTEAARRGVGDPRDFRIFVPIVLFVVDASEEIDPPSEFRADADFLRRRPGICVAQGSDRKWQIPADVPRLRCRRIRLAKCWRPGRTCQDSDSSTGCTSE
jgi:hypothetical protein